MTRAVVDGRIMCPDCTRWLAVTDEHWSFRPSGKPHSYCRPCSAARARRWYNDHPERARASREDWKSRNPERHRAAIDAHRAANREHYREMMRRYARKNADRLYRQYRVRYEATKAQVRAKSAAWLRAHPERAREMAMVKAMRRRGAPLNSEARGYARLLLLDPCCYCGAQASRPSIDHIVPLSRGGTSAWDNLTAACSACNSSKGRLPLLLHLYRRSS